ncbi:MAG TPA: DAK2 domain-containing protein [Oscillospiraceae bacterium]|nr:DAK2 domain-containing protein [Oscillospiraceae bacterium]
MINGRILRDGILSASNNINNHKKSVDALNVFPVPDGDTGTNMSLTMSAAARELSHLSDDATVSEVATAASSALLRGARGNSGVILSLIFRGIGAGLKNVKQADAKDFALALSLGVDNAYKAVMKPTEGTILTVARLFTKEALDCLESGDTAFEKVWENAMKAGNEALLDTPNILPILKKAGVVDAGGQGLMYIFEGMESVFLGKGIIKSKDTDTDFSESFVITDNINEDIEFAYCTEFIVMRSKDNEQPSSLLRAYLESIGDSVVVVDDDNIIKVHCHSNEPGNILQNALNYGYLVDIKIDNMRVQSEHSSQGKQTIAETNEVKGTVPEDKEVLQPKKHFGMVAVALGSGIKEVFSDIGVDKLVSGGQTMNPSTDDILSAIEKVPAREVFILPNNKNIIMAAEQTIPLTNKVVRVLHTRSVAEGVAAALAFDESLPGEENHLNMTKSAENVSTALITYAARDSKIGSQPVKKGNILGMENGKITVIDDSILQTTLKTVKHLIKKNTSLITVYYGEDIKQEQANELIDALSQKYGKECEIIAINGGQPVYYYIISLE